MKLSTNNMQLSVEYDEKSNRFLRYHIDNNTMVKTLLHSEEHILHFCIDESTMTERLVRAQKILYEAPAGLCLSHLLNNTLIEFAKQLQQIIRKDIGVILANKGVSYNFCDSLNDQQYYNRANAHLLTLDWGNPFGLPPSVLTDELFHPATCFLDDLIAYENTFDITDYYSDYFTDNTTEKPYKKNRLEVIQEIINEYVLNLDCDMIFREFAFFYHLFNSNLIGIDSLLPVAGSFDINQSMFEAAINVKSTFNRIKNAYSSFRTNTPMYTVRSYVDTCIATLDFVIKHGFSIKRCQNCGQYFIPRNRSDEIYCENPSPQNSNKTCKQYGTTHLWYDKIKDDPILKRCKNLYNEKQMRARRYPDVKVYNDNFECFKRQSLEWKKRYKAGACTAEEFSAWLDEQKARKT